MRKWRLLLISDHVGPNTAYLCSFQVLSGFISFHLHFQSVASSQPEVLIQSLSKSIQFY